jgi:AraC-like DNA-binding protein
MEQVILISSFLVPLVLSLVILFNSANNPAKKTLGLSMLNAAAVFLANYFYFIQDFDLYVYLHSIHVALVLFIYPSLYIYLKQLTENYKITARTYLHLLPGTLFFVLYFLLFDIQFELSERISFLSNYRDKSFNIDRGFIFVEWIRLINVAFIIAQVAGYSFAIFKSSRKFHLRLKNEYSNDEGFRIKWLVWFNIALIVVAVLSVLFYVVNPFNDTNNLLLIVSMFSMSVFVWLIGIWGNAQKTIVLPAAIENNNHFNNETNEIRLIYDDLVQMIQQKKLYLNPCLTLTGLATSYGTNRTYISQAINLIGEMNFNAFINKFRINEATRLLSENPKIKIEELANQAGFGSSISLQRAFVKYKGIPIKEWKIKKVAFDRKPPH